MADSSLVDVRPSFLPRAVSLARRIHEGAMGTAHPRCDRALHSLANYVMRYETRLREAEALLERWEGFQLHSDALYHETRRFLDE